MAKRNDFKNANKKIKIPVYVSELVESPSTDVFESYNEMINYVTNLIDNFNEKSEDEKMVLGRKDKCKVRTIRTIDYTKYAFGTTPVILLQISEHATGITDMFVESDEKKQIGDKDRVGSDYNCALLYPVISIKGLQTSNNWLIFVYDDPGKDDSDVINTVKAVVKKALNLKIQHVKSQKASEEIKKVGVIPQMSVQYITITNNNNERIELEGYRVSSKVKTTEYLEFEEIPSEEVDSFVTNPKDTNYSKRNVRVIFGNNKELRYTHTMNEDSQTVKDAIEQIFNYEKEISNSDLFKMYEPEFILKIIKKAVEEYLSNE